jgi:bromodomain-containing protein 7/9
MDRQTLMYISLVFEQYGLFLDPVDEQEFPGYLDMIGGSENAMDLATMEEKIDAGRYKTMDQFEVSRTR